MLLVACDGEILLQRKTSPSLISGSAINNNSIYFCFPAFSTLQTNFLTFLRSFKYGIHNPDIAQAFFAGNQYR